jgi:hypothetical protein
MKMLSNNLINDKNRFFDNSARDTHAICVEDWVEDMAEDLIKNPVWNLITTVKTTIYFTLPKKDTTHEHA